MSIWNPNQKHLIGSAFIPENRPPVPFSDCPLPSSFCFQGNAYRKTSTNRAIRLDSREIVDFPSDLLVMGQTNTKPIWQDAFGAGSR